eukprot:1158596-Pelagomonas_calceolata.AAC.1
MTDERATHSRVDHCSRTHALEFSSPMLLYQKESFIGILKHLNIWVPPHALTSGTPIWGCVFLL